MFVRLATFNIYKNNLTALASTKLLINTINAHCFNLLHYDQLYQNALLNSDVLIPDGVSVVWSIRWLTGQKLQKIAGADLFFYEMERIKQTYGKCFFLGSNETTLIKIKDRAFKEYPNVKIQTYSPPYKKEFTIEESQVMVGLINTFQPDVLFVGMTAPKQEKWAYQYFNELQVGHVCCIGAVFDFYAGTINRAPQWIIKLGLEWIYRLFKEPRRMWKRYLIGNIKFILAIIIEKYMIITRNSQAGSIPKTNFSQ